jgi:3-dehydro-L-gulonate 2-dehydrogenase
MEEDFMQVAFSEMKNQFVRVLKKHGFTDARADQCASLFAEASLDGVPSHGLNRFPLFIDYIVKGYVDPSAEPTRIASLGAIERWDGHRGPGNLNAQASMKRAIELARDHGMGCVALSNTNHWMRAGSYGWQAAEEGCVGICWTNTTPNLPPWGSIEGKVGNNPIVFAVPRSDGHLVLDVAMSQFSYGQLNNYRLSGQKLPVDGGYDTEGQLSRDAEAILETKRVLPIGYWKGSGMALMLDMIGMVLSGGLSTREIGELEAEQSVTQVFITFDTRCFPDPEELARRMDETIHDLKTAAPVEPEGAVRYPGEDTLRRRKQNLEYGIPVEANIWERVLQL